MKKIFTLIITLFIFLGCDTKVKESNLQNGDIIFQDSTSSQSKAIKLATHSKYSHMGIIYKTSKGLFVYEASATVRLTPFSTWVNSGVNQHYVVKRLKDTKQLTAKNFKKMQTIGKTFENHPYDILFGWGDSKIYCSELVWKIYKRALNIELGKLKKLKSFDLTHLVVQAKLKERYGNKIPLNEQ
ncbi:MAG TPA: YiiX family permuted papain-like enzyme, partial [Campylobacterales bacterium]|nr:YiiX family permuted papain-like enzyme [Campylobacterales bacterium]